MTSPPVHPGGTAIFCDDVRIENTGKHLYLGVYLGQMVISPSFPAMLPTFAVVFRYRERAAEERRPLKFLIYVPGQSDPAFQTELSTEQIDSFPVLDGDGDEEGEELLVDVTIMATFKNFVIPEAGKN